MVKFCLLPVILLHVLHEVLTLNLILGIIIIIGIVNVVDLFLDILLAYGALAIEEIIVVAVLVPPEVLILAEI